MVQVLRSLLNRIIFISVIPTGERSKVIWIGRFLIDIDHGYMKEYSISLYPDMENPVFEITFPMAGHPRPAPRENMFAL